MHTTTQSFWVVLGAMGLLIAATGCQQSSDSGPAPEQSEVRPAVSSTQGPSATVSASSSSPLTPQPSASSASPSASASSAASSAAAPTSGKPKTLSLAEGATANLSHFDVTLLRSTYGKDGVSHGWKVRVCYTHPHPGQNADGTTRVSTDPWSVRVADMEGDGNVSWLPIDEFPADKGWEPPYPERKLRVGECAEGWIAIKHGNPDLAFSGLRYQPADFGDEVTWKTR